LRPNHAAKSNRQSFRSVPVEASVLQYIQKVGVGIPSRRKRKRNRPNRSDYKPYIVLPDVYSNRTDPIPPPPPFGHNSRVRAVASLGSAADLAPYLHVDEQPIQRSARGGGSSEGSRSGSRTRTTSPTSRVVAEVALAGRSNVGKSTLLNALLYGNKQRPNNANTNKGLGKGPDKAVMSPRPGETRQITLYHISSSPRPPALSSSDTQSKADDESSSPSPSSSRGSSSLRVADLPGYGFAYSGTDDKEELVKRYVLGRDPRALKRLLLLVDARHGLKQSDVDFLMRLQAEKSPEQEEEYAAPGGGGGKSAKQRQKRRGRRRPGGGGSLPPVQIVLTKCDLVPQADLARRVTLVRRQLADILRRETGNLPVMLVAARSTLLPPSPRSRGGPGAASPPRRRDGVLELQRELAALVAPTRR
jgi:GTP-binding protein